MSEHSERMKIIMSDPEVRKRMSESHRKYFKEHPMTDEQKRKISLSKKGIFAKEKHPRWKHFIDEDIQEIIRLYTIELLSLDSIGEKFSCSLGPVRRILTSQGIEIRKANNPIYFERRKPHFKSDNEDD